jgi:hypothetical protein
MFQVLQEKVVTEKWNTTIHSEHAKLGMHENRNSKNSYSLYFINISLI